MLRDLRYRAEYLALLALSGLFRLVPIETTTALAARLARSLGPRFSKKKHGRALANLKIAFPDMTEEERLRICLAHWENLGRVAAETLQIDRLIATPDRFEMLSPKIFKRYKDKLGPIIGVSLHMGNWELAIWPLFEAGASPGALYRSLANPYIDRYVRRLRSKLYPGGLLGRRSESGEDDAAIARLAMDFVRCGGRLGIICDQHYAKGTVVTFFGRSTRTQPLAAILARRSGARVWICRCLRVGTASRFKIEMLELRIPRTKNKADDIRAALAGIHSQFEAWIRDAPEQWIWSNKIWV